MPMLNKTLLALLCASGAVFAEPVSVDFKAATVVDVVQLVVRDVMKRDYVIAPDVLQLDKRITVAVKKVEPEKIAEVLASVLKTVDVEMVTQDGILYVQKIRPAEPKQAAQMEPQKAIEPKMPGQGDDKDRAKKIPDVIASYRPRGRTLAFLAEVAKAAGASVIENGKASGDRLVYYGTDEAVEKARKILEDVDTPPQAVKVRAVVLEYTDTKTDTRSLQVALSLLDGKLGAIYEAGKAVADQVFVKTGTLTAALSAIEGDNRFRFLAEPTMRVLDGEIAKFTVGSQVPTVGATLMSANGNTQQSIEYKTAGLLISVEPRILDGGITMKVQQQISQFATTTTSNIDSPTIMTREAQTTVAMKPGELVILAGLDQTTESGSSSGLSFLPAFMQSKNNSNSRSQILLMLEAIPEGTAI